MTLERGNPPLTERVEAGTAREARLEAALYAIAWNAEAWHGDNAAKANALAVIAKTARKALRDR